MIIFENGTWQMDSSHPNTNYLEGVDCEQPKWSVSDDSGIAAKILELSQFVPVEDENGNLIDVKPVEPTQEQQAAEIKQQLADLDAQAVRPLRAVVAGTATDEDRDKLLEIEAQAEILRAELTELGGDD